MSLIRFRQILALALPIILSNISTPLLGLADTAVLGHLSSSDYLAGVTLGASLFTFLFWGFGFLRMGTTGIVAQSWGRNDYQNVINLLCQGIVLALLIALILLILHPVLIPVGLNGLSSDQQLTSLAADYAFVRIWAAPAALINYVLLGWFLALQNSRFSFWMLVLGNSLNIVLDLWFVMGLGWQVKGVALASVIADYTVLVTGCWLAFKRIQELKSLHPDIRIHPDIKGIGRLFRVNHQLLVRTWVLLFAMVFFTAQGATYGADILAANAILMQMVMFVSYAADGLAHATEALAGEQAGQNNQEQLQQIIQHSALLSLLLCLSFSLVYLIAGQSIAAWMTSIPEVLNATGDYQPWLVMIPLLAAGSYLLDGVYIGLTRTEIMRNTILLSTSVYLLIWWLSQPLANHGLWLAFTGFTLSRSASLYWHYRYCLIPEMKDKNVKTDIADRQK